MENSSSESDGLNVILVSEVEEDGKEVVLNGDGTARIEDRNDRDN